MTLRTRLFLPIYAVAIVGPIAIAFANSNGSGDRILPTTMVALTAALLTAAFAHAAIRRVVLRPLRELAPRGTLRTDAAMPASGAAADEIAAVGSALASANTEARELRARVDREIALRQTAEQARRTGDDLYVLAVTSANDGLWEWNLRTGEVIVSPRWCTLAGLPAEAFGGTVEAWKARVHQDDRARVDGALEAHLAGREAQYRSEHRIVGADGSLRWVLSRATALRHANGSAYRMVGLDADITAYKRIEEILMRIADLTAGSTGIEFFRALVMHFAAALRVREAFVTECVDHPPTRVRALACWDRDHFIDEEYELAPTPCRKVIEEGTTCFIPRDLGKLFPNELPYGFESYLGVPIFGRSGRVLGHLVFKDDRPMSDDCLIESVYRIFAARAGMEIERIRREDVLVDLAWAPLSATRGTSRLDRLAASFAAMFSATSCIVGRLSSIDPGHVDVIARHGPEQLESGNASLVKAIVTRSIARGTIEFSSAEGLAGSAPRTGPAGWLAIPCTAADGKVHGSIVCFYQDAMPGEMPDREMAARAGASAAAHAFYSSA